ncbi:MAG: TonB-dependent siderophore receptor [Pseudomonadota bacterium]
MDLTTSARPSESAATTRRRPQARYSLGRCTALAIAAYASSTLMVVAQESEDGSVDEEIIVTGRFQNSLVNRLPITIEELPYSLDVIDRSFLDERGFVRPLEALQTIPNVVISGDQFSSGGLNFLVRGFDASILVNNRPETSSRGFGRRDNAFVERYEVLKGPASISLGPVLPGGIINTVTKLPELDPFVDVELRGGSFGTIRGMIDANGGALFGSDAVRGRLTMAYEDAQFAADNAARETFAVRPVVEIDFSPRTRSNFSVAYRDLDTVPDLDFPIFQDGSIPEAFENDVFFGPPDNVGGQGEDILVDGEVQHEFLDNLKLTVRGSYQDTNPDYQNSQGLYNYNFDEGLPGIAPSNPVGNFYSSTGSFDEEVTYFDAQLAWSTSIGSAEIDFVFGGTLQETNGLSTFGFDGFNAVVDITDPDFDTVPVPVNTVEPTPFFDFTTELASLYAEVIFRPTPRLTIPVGVRFDDLENTLRDPTSGGDDLAEDDFVQETVEEDDDVSFRIGATYSVTENANVYASFAQSFIPQSGVLRSGNPVGPETAVSYEVGTKTSFLNGRLRLRAAAFNTVRQDVANSDPNNGVGDFFVVAVGEQRHRGFELALNGQIAPGWDIDLSYGYLDAEFTENLDGLEGLRPSVAPDNTFSAYTSYRFQQPNLSGLQIGGGVRFLDDRPGSTGSGLTYDGYTLVDFFASYRFNERYRLQVNVNNLLDESYLESVGNSGRPNGGFNFGEPLVVLGTLNMTFGGR